MYLPNQKPKLFCLENLAEHSHEDSSMVIKHLEQLALKQGQTSVYKSCQCIDTFEQSLEVLLYQDHEFIDYQLLYLVCKGQDDYIELDRYTYTLQEIAERFEGKLSGKVIHFSNQKALNLDSEQSQYFLDITQATALSGYTHQHLISSTPLDMAFFALFDPEMDITELVETLFEKNYKACMELGFHLYY